MAAATQLATKLATTCLRRRMGVTSTAYPFRITAFNSDALHDAPPLHGMFPFPAFCNEPSPKHFAPISMTPAAGGDCQQFQYSLTPIYVPVVEMQKSSFARLPIPSTVTHFVQRQFSSTIFPWFDRCPAVQILCILIHRVVQISQQLLRVFDRHHLQPMPRSTFLYFRRSDKKPKQRPPHPIKDSQLATVASRIGKNGN